METKRYVSGVFVREVTADDGQQSLEVLIQEEICEITSRALTKFPGGMNIDGESIFDQLCRKLDEETLTSSTFVNLKCVVESSLLNKHLHRKIRTKGGIAIEKLFYVIFETDEVPFRYLPIRQNSRHGGGNVLCDIKWVDLNKVETQRMPKDHKAALQRLKDLVGDCISEMYDIA